MHVARNSLLLFVVVAASTSCIVTGSPDFSDEEPTVPLLSVVEPAATELLCVTRDTAPRFSVNVYAEDGSGENLNQLNAVLLRDYGVPKDIGLDNPRPYQEAIGNREIAAGKLATARLVSRSWDTIEFVQPPSCHSITMLVVREPYGDDPYALCPLDDQYAMVTWYVGVRAADETTCDFSACPVDGQGEFVYCPTPDELNALAAEPP